MGFEGGYTNNPNDTGLETKYGITVKVARENNYNGDMKDLPLATAKQIAKKSYWDACQCDAMPDVIKYPLFDAAYHSGPGQAIKWLQSAAGVKSDGVIGPMTHSAVAVANHQLLCQQMIGKRLRFMTDLKNWPSFARGWARRVASLLEM